MAVEIVCEVNVFSTKILQSKLGTLWYVALSRQIGRQEFKQNVMGDFPSKLKKPSYVHRSGAVSPIPSSSASPSQKGNNMAKARSITIESPIFLTVPTSLTSFKQGFSGALCNKSHNAHSTRHA